MAYNPFDDVIENDPAYMQTGGELQRSVLPQRRVNYVDDGQSERMAEIARGPVNFIGDIFAQTMGRIAENMVNPEAAERGRQKNEINKEIANYYNVVPQQITPAMNEDYFKKFGKEYQQLNFQEGINSGLNFFLEDAIKGSQAIQSGEKRFTDLPGNQKLGVGLLPLEFWLGGFGRKAAQGVGNEVLSKYKDMPLGELVANPQARQEIPEVVAEVENQYPILITQQQRVMPVDQTPGVAMAQETGIGLASSTPIKQQVKNKITNYFENNPSPTSRTRLMEELGLSDNKSLVKSLFNEKTIDSDLKKYSSLLMDEVDLRAKEKITEGFEKLKDVEGPLSTMQIENISGVSRVLLNRHFVANRKNSLEKNIISPEQADFFDSIFVKGQEGRTINRDKKVSEMKKDLIANPEKQGQKGSYYLDNYGLTKSTLSIAKNTDPEIYALTTRVNKKGVPVEFGDSEKMSIGKIRNILDLQADDVDVSIITDLYRGTKNIEDYTPDQFLGLFKKQNPNYKNTRFYKNTKKKYKELEDDRLKAQNKGFKFFDTVRKDPKYGKYLKDSDRLQFGFQKAHAFPIDETTQMGRFENMAQMSDMIFVSDMTSNVRLQNRFDPDLIEIARLGSKENMDRLATIPTNGDLKAMGINLPKIIERLKEYGINVLPEEFQNMRQLIFGKDKGIVEQINKLYQKFDTGSVIPIGKTNYGLVGKNPKKISPEKRLNNLKKRFMEILDDQVLYEKTNGKKGKPIMRTPKKDDMEGGFIKGLQDGGEVKPVRMAMGGDPLQNINQQQFSPDPAIDQDYFQEAVDSGNLQAFNPTKIFRLFQKTDAVYTPKKLPDAVDTQQIAPPGTTLPTTQTVQPEDFAFQSFTLNKINDAQAPKAGTSEAWKQYLYGGGQGGKAPESEMFDSGLEQYLDDFSKYYPNQKITKQQLNDYYEMSPIGNIEIKVKGDLTNEEITNPGYREYVGGPRHRNEGNQPLDEVGTNYREIVVNSGPLPGDKKPFVESGHFRENNVLGFTRVANYTQPDGKSVAVIQEMQTDMLTKVRKEQERLQAFLKRIENIKATANREIQTGDTFRGQDANRILDTLNAKIPPAVEQSLIQNADLIKPFPNEAARSTIPDYQKQLTELQSQIDSILSKDIKQSNPETGFTLKNISDKQQVVLDNLMDLNRSGQLDDLLKGIDVPATRETDELRRYAEDPNVRYLEDGLSYRGTKKLELFPPIPFNKQADYVDLLLKATIKDAQSRGIQKVAIYPSDLVNQRWGKNPDSDAGKKFKDLYGKVAIQQMKNIAKKYGGTAKVETVMNPNLSDRGLSFYKRNLEGEYEFLKQDQLAKGLDPEEAQLLINEQLGRNANTLGANQVIYSREIAPGQTMDYYVQPIPERVEMQASGEFSAKNEFELVPLGPGDDRNAAQVLIEEYDPREIQMFTITLDSDKAQKPMFMFKKKSGGTIAKDSLLSITDIYGEYGR
tara:strand:- start:2878 stop:7260 length:4383 start_codon:yes stop_codon:yes gene_type:complete